jgi:hypothetical protein
LMPAQSVLVGVRRNEVKPRGKMGFPDFSKGHCHIREQRNYAVQLGFRTGESLLSSLSEDHSRELGGNRGGTLTVSLKLLILQILWRRVRDLNPRYPFRYVGFQDRCNQPLCQLSVFAIIRQSAITRLPRNRVEHTGITQSSKHEIPIAG